MTFLIAIAIILIVWQVGLNHICNGVADSMRRSRERRDQERQHRMNNQK